jgi:hypothetical protein
MARGSVRDDDEQQHEDPFVTVEQLQARERVQAQARELQHARMTTAEREEERRVKAEQQDRLRREEATRRREQERRQANELRERRIADDQRAALRREQEEHEREDLQRRQQELEQIEDEWYLAQQQEREKQELEELERRDQQSRERLERERMERERMERERMERKRMEHERRELAYHSGHHEAIDGASTPVHRAMIGHQEPNREEFATPHQTASDRHEMSPDEFTPAQRAAIDTAIRAATQEAFQRQLQHPLTTTTHKQSLQDSQDEK